MRSLLALEGEAFVRGAYATILGRLADSDGLAHCLAELQKGVTKMTIVSRMRNSVEGKKADRSVQGYERAWLQSRIQWWRSGG
jgi:hypothetical protein